MSGLDPAIHAVARLELCGLLAPVDDAEFSFLRDRLNVSDSVLSKHAKALEQVGYLHIVKITRNGRQRTLLSLTPAGRRAFRSHVDELRRLAAVADPSYTAHD
ncbi:winged helix-turn-helix domain-containing protein [Microbacterium sp. 4-7]|uniref:winged helix-turn-helix domain-containing protein n=1 Tax=Microbacterium sp. 4-7 TaxID=1885327 RepID=UPI00164F38C3|nr:transcriptional regulator [Microbacterium sp. 4-7]MBC6493729.1 MarR family transcriptional regulator [Microbacterium sp. 4-7]